MKDNTKIYGFVMRYLQMLLTVLPVYCQPEALAVFHQFLIHTEDSSTLALDYHTMEN